MTDNLSISKYSEHTIVVRGNTRLVARRLTSLKGRYNPNLKGGSGWLFHNNKRNLVQSYIDSLSKTTIPYNKEITTIPYNKEITIYDKEKINEFFVPVITLVNYYVKEILDPYYKKKLTKYCAILQIINIAGFAMYLTYKM
jgi:hypothetical protein